MSRKYLTIEETAKELEVSGRTIYNYLRLGYLQKSKRKNGKSVGRNITVVTTDSLFKYMLIPMYSYLKIQKEKYMKRRIKEAEYSISHPVGIIRVDPLNTVELNKQYQTVVDFWTYEKTALICNVSARTVKRWVADGKIPISYREGKYNIVYLNNLDVLDYVFHREITGIKTNKNHYDIIYETLLQLCTVFLHRYEMLENHLKQIDR